MYIWSNSWIHNNTGRVQIQDRSHRATNHRRSWRDRSWICNTTSPLTLSYNNNYYYVTLMVKLLSSIGNETVPKITLNFALRMARSVKQHCAGPMYPFDSFMPDMVRCLLDCLRFLKSFLQIMKNFCWIKAGVPRFVKRYECIGSYIFF